MHNGHQIAYAAEGDPSAPPIIMLHGWFSHRDTWHQTVAALKDRCYCVAIDLLGFGDSAKPKDGDYSIKAQGQRVLALADHLEIDRFIVIGHSMGGQIALCLASTLAPERIIKVVSVAGVVSGRLTRGVTWGVSPLIVIMYWLPFLVTTMRWLNRYPWFVKKFSFWPWFYDMDALPLEDWEIDRQKALQPGIATPAYKAGRAIMDLDLTPHLPNITVPTLVIFGQQDATVRVSDGHLVNEHVPNSQLVLIDKCGHFPHYEHPAQYLAALEAFLNT
jgi:pimeloyl-ACP methyl ester carboxylesterase